MYRTCIASLCFSNCCDYYAYCVYPNQTPFCYTNITYYYYDYTWVWIVSSIVLLCIIISAIAGIRRRRMMRRQQQEIIIETNSGPSFVQGQPVYNNDLIIGNGGQGYYNQNNGMGQPFYANQNQIYQ